MGLFDIVGSLTHDIFGFGSGNQSTPISNRPMVDWMNQFIKPQASYLQTTMEQPINKAFLSYLQGGPSGAMDAALTGAEAGASYAARPGGSLQKDVLQAEGGMAGKGFGPGGAEGNVNAIMNAFLSNFGNQFTSQAVPLAQQWAQSLGQGAQGFTADVTGLGTDVFTGLGNIQQLGLANQQQNIANQGVIGQIFGNL